MNGNRYAENDEMEIDLIELAQVLLKKWWLILSVAVVGFVMAVGITKFAITPQYQSKAMLYVLSNTTSVTSVADLQIGTAITGDFEVIATSKPVIDKAIEAIKNEQNITFTRKEILQMVEVSSIEDTRILVITATGDNAKHACYVANAVTEATAQRMAEITKKDPPTTVEKAEVSKVAVSPSTAKNAILGFLIGAVLVCAVLVVRYLLNDNIKTAADVDKYLGEIVLISIPYVKGREGKKEELLRLKGGTRAKK